MPVPTSALQVTISARTEDLLEALATSLAAPVGDPTYRECIVVQSLGMARWLELQLSARFGIWANAWFPFPEAFTYSLWRAVHHQERGTRRSPLDRETVGWAVAASLPALLDEPAFEPLRTWLGATPRTGRLLALSQRVGAIFHTYLLSRPDLLLAWEDDPASHWLPPDMPEGAAADAAWQAPLWRSVVAHTGVTDGEHPARRLRDVARTLEDSPAPRDLGPDILRVSVFGLSTLSPPYVRSLTALARHVPTRMYSLSPSPADAQRVMAAAQQQGWAGWDALPLTQDVDQLLAGLPQTHPLVNDQASAVRSFHILSTLAGADVQQSSAAAAPPMPALPSLLQRLQTDVARGQRPTPNPAALSAIRAGTDRSLGLHSCHGPLREVEVLRDQLLAAFDELPDLAPHEVVVMVPDVEAYAPHVEAVFGMGRSEHLAIPFRVADRPSRADRPGAQAFLRLLQLLRGRMTAPEVLDLLALAPVRAARGLDDGSIDHLHGWIESVGIRWGLDADHRAAVGQPALATNTWQWGLSRLALGWAAPGDGRQRFHGVLPFAAAGSEPALLGQFAAFVDLLARWRRELLDVRYSVEHWAERLGLLLAELLGDGAAGEEDRLLVETALGDLHERARAARYTGRVGLDTLTSLLGDTLNQDLPARGFLEGVVTVCALQPMRAIPFRVVALMGMNDGAFPRTERPPGFDLAARQPRLGDTPRRAADRLLFLEALMSAREQLIITWTGRDPRTDTELPPSVVVSELLDVLQTMAGPDALPGGAVDAPADRAATELGELVLRHPLHPFSRKYFTHRDGPRWFSYSTAYVATAGRSGALRRPKAPLSTGFLPPPPRPESEEIVALPALARFLEAPARRFVRDRLGIDLPARDLPLADREPMTLEPLERYHVGEAMLAALVDGAAPDEAVAIALAEGRLPLGTPGQLAVGPVRAVAERLAMLARPLYEGGPARTEPVDLALPSVSARLVGALDGLRPLGRLELGYGRLDVRRELRLWVRHLALNMAVADGALIGCPPVSWAVGRAVSKGEELAVLRLAPLSDAPARLAELVALWQEAETGALPFFPLAARAYLAAVAAMDDSGEADDGAEPAAQRAAAEAFGADRRESESDRRWTRGVDLDDADLALLLGEALPWDPDGRVVDQDVVARFQALAVAVFAPLDAVATRAVDDEARALVAEAGA
jgi:exodeoxyribonuclease V gamma subunit